MADVFMHDPATGRVALFHEPTLTGDPLDPDAPRNAPLNSPAENLQHLYFHTDYDPMEVAIGPQVVPITHATIPAGSNGSDDVATVTGYRNYGDVIRTHVLLNHDLGYVPDFFVMLDADVVHPGFPVQFDAGDGRFRCVTPFATTSQILLHEFGVQTNNSMAARALNYTVLVLRRPPSPTGDALFEFDPSTGVVAMGRGKFRSDRRYLQVVEGGTPFGLPTGRTIDLRNGTFRSVSPDGTIRDVVPAIFKISFGLGGPVYGPSGNYNGSFTGLPAVLVQAP